MPENDSKSAGSQTMGVNSIDPRALDTVRIEKTGMTPECADQLSDSEKNTEVLPDVNAPIEALAIENWQELEKKLVKRLDMTLMPMLWVLYLFNYLDRASISYFLP